MSHHPNIISPEGTPLAERTVGKLVAERPGRSRVFQSFGIDFCCQGGRTLREACERKGVSLDGVIEHLEAELAGGYQPPEDACNTYRALFAGLADLEEDLHRHIHLENSVLFPAAEALSGSAVKQPVGNL